MKTETDGKTEPMEIRKAQDADSDRIKSIVFTILEEYGLKPDSNSTDQDLDCIEASYADNGGYFGVVTEDDAIIATVGLHRESETTCELRKMYCIPAGRGKGLGKKMLEFSLEKARELGFSRIVLETASPLREAIGLYKKYGFVEYKPDHLSKRCDQAYELYL